MSSAAVAPTLRYARLGPGDPAPWFHARTSGNPRYAFDTAAGRSILLCFFGTANDGPGREALMAIEKNRALFDDERACVFAVSVDPADEAEGRAKDSMPGVRVFWDFDGAVSRAYGALHEGAKPGEGPTPMRRLWALLDPTLRVVEVLAFPEAGESHEKIFDLVRRQPPAGETPGFPIQAPVLILPNAFEPDFCRLLIGLYDAHGGEESGFMREVGGKTVMLHDRAHKRRRDFMIEDRPLIEQTQRRILRRIVPEIKKVHNFQVTRMERYLVACYAAEDAAHFRAHRDNMTKGTAHRRFAVSINLNDDFDGGEVSFPEYGPRGFKAPAGGAVVFSCGLLHAVSQVTRGRRYAFLPFLYDDEAAKIREANNAFLGEGVTKYNG